MTGGEGEGGIKFSAFVVQVNKTETNKLLVGTRAGLFPLCGLILNCHTLLTAAASISSVLL